MRKVPQLTIFALAKRMDFSTVGSFAVSFCRMGAIGPHKAAGRWWRKYGPVILETEKLPTVEKNTLIGKGKVVSMCRRHMRCVGPLTDVDREHSIVPFDDVQLNEKAQFVPVLLRGRLADHRPREVTWALR